MAKSIMIQGTMSSAGKSLIVAGLCRIMKQDGYKVAPFKSQNMALNSFITKEGLEMGRAQVMQAEAAKIEPNVYMNPILLKPTNDIGSQVIVNGEVYKNMSAREYFAYKRQLIPEIEYAFNKLSEENDIIVIEGAGSPVEINLKKDDIVNMGMAKIANSPVLLVGDIDRGGVFAQLCGTMMLLEEDEKELVKGLIINKFRGDKTILDPGIDMLENLTGKKVVATVPYMDVNVEDEDSLTERFGRNSKVNDIDIAVIRLPHISNFTDFNILENADGVSVRYVNRVYDIGNPDMIILPGTKSTMEDMRWLKETGMETVILKKHDKGTPIWGICGGYQMLGESIVDEVGAETSGSINGLGLIPMVTVFEDEKERTRVNGVFGEVRGIFSDLSGLELEGYEIHMGQAKMNDDSCVSSLTKIENSVDHSAKQEGYCGTSQDGLVYGTFIHGIFDRHEVAETIINALAKKKGIDKPQSHLLDYAAYKETQYDKLADMLRESIDMEYVYSIIGIK